MILFNLIGILLIAFVIWWFWLSKPKLVQAKQDIVPIVVKDGVYSPARIEASSTKPITLEFLRQDSTSCSEYLMMEQLDIYEQLPLNKKHRIALGQLAPGTYSFTCQMKMYAGELIIKP